MKRKSIPLKKSKKLFTNTARPHVKNLKNATPPRGGYRL